MIQLSESALFILVEGEPNSPELFFFTNVIPKIIDETGWSGSSIELQVVEVGGSSAFKTFAKVCYRLSKRHRNNPILAIADSDYRVKSGKKQDDNSKLIKDQVHKTLYWPRHEWENYLLEETKWLADWVNQIPLKSTHKGRVYKTSSTVVDHQQLDDFLLNYFRQSLRTEYWECLKFNLVRQIDKYPSVEKPRDFDFDTTKNFSEIKQWFENQANQLKGEVIFTKKSPTLFKQIMDDDELKWEAWLTSSKLVDLPSAKKRFRGKEAFKALCEFLKEEFGIHNFDKTVLIGELLTELASKDSSDIFQDLRKLLLPEFTGFGNSHGTVAP